MLFRSDIDAARCARIFENLQRLGLQAQVVVADAANLAAWWTDCLLVCCEQVRIARESARIAYYFRVPDFDASRRFKTASRVEVPDILAIFVGS